MFKYVFMILSILIVTTNSYAAPYAISDAQTDITSYVLSGPVWVPTTLKAETNGSLKLDVANAIVNVSTSITVSPCISDPIWGEACGAPVPFSFTRPKLTIPTSTHNIRLSK